MKLNNNIQKKIKQSGLFEFIYLSAVLFITFVISRIKILVLNIRSYDIDQSAHIGARVIFFQSRKHAIRVGKNVEIGSGAILKAGFNGKIIIHNNVSIHEYSKIYSHKDLVIGKGTMIAPGCFITDFDHKFVPQGFHAMLLKKEGYNDETTTIGENVWIGASSIVLKGVTIGDNVVIGAGSVVTKSIPSFSIAVGNPARVIKKIKK